MPPPRCSQAFISGVRAERRCAEELRGRNLALPVVRRAVAHFRRAARHRIEHFQCRNQLTRRVDLDLQAAAAHLVDQLRETLGTDAHAREVLRPDVTIFQLKVCCSLACLLSPAAGFSLLSLQPARAVAARPTPAAVRMSRRFMRVTPCYLFLLRIGRATRCCRTACASRSVCAHQPDWQRAHVAKPAPEVQTPPGLD